MSIADNTALGPPPLATPITQQGDEAGVPWQNRVDNGGVPSGNLQTSWAQWFNKLATLVSTSVFLRTLLVKDTTVGNNIADNVTVYAQGTARGMTGVLRLAIAADLTVRVNLDGSPLITATIPSATAVDTVLTFTGFAANPQAMPLNGVLTWDITASDGSKDAAGVASFTLLWK